MPAKPDEILARRQQIEAPLDPNRYTALRRLVTDPDHRLVVCFGGGSAVALGANAALAQILEELDLKAHVSQVWGTSAGAIIAAGFAAGVGASEIRHRVKAAEGSLDICWLRLVLSVLLRPFGYPLPEGLIKGRRIAALIEAGLPVKTFEECPIPFRCIAVSDDGQARRTVLRQGPLLPAIYASMTLPGIFMPHGPPPGHDCSYYDGGIVEKTPLRSPISEHLRSGDSRKLLLLATHFRSHGHLPPARSFAHRFLQTIGALEDLAWPYQLAEARKYPNVVLVLLDPQIEVVNVLDLSLLERHYLQGREAFSDQLQNARLALSLGIK
ncbi:MAG TPA: patatin-like phospholipase family protein [Candidatus Binatia bacterium]|nr:patatin-like phospholipase family protein [Candidatus Binatia bacterium]